MVHVLVTGHLLMHQSPHPGAHLWPRSSLPVRPDDPSGRPPPPLV